MWFQESTSERSNNVQYAMRFNLSASRFKPYIGAEHVRTRVRRSPEIDARARRVDRNVRRRVRLRSVTAHGPYGLGAARRLDYEEGERFRNVALDAALNRSGRAADAGVRYAITPLTTLSVTAGYEEQTFKESHVRDLKRYTVGPTLEFSPEAAIRGRVVTAFELFKPDDPSLSRADGYRVSGAAQLVALRTDDLRSRSGKKYQLFLSGHRTLLSADECRDCS